MPGLLIIGSSNLDHCLNVARFPTPGETLNSKQYFQAYGGKGANQAVAAARLGAKTTFISTLGDDAAGHAMRQYFIEQGIDVQHIQLINGKATGLAMILIDQHGENQIVLHDGANAALDSTFIEQYTTAAIKECDALLLQLETPLDGIIQAATIAAQHDRRTYLNPAPYCGLPDTLLSLIDTITPNETEATELTGIKPDTTENMQAACDYLHAKGIREVLITLGSKGVYLSNEQIQQHYPGFDVKAVDTTAAGDTFNGAYFAAQLNGLSTHAAIAYAQAAAALAIQQAGAQSSIPSQQAVQNFLDAQA